MKKIKNIILGLLIIIATNVSAQTTPPNTTNGHGLTTNQAPPGGGAPIENGLFILLSLGSAFGVYSVKRRNDSLKLTNQEN